MTATPRLNGYAAPLSLSEGLNPITVVASDPVLNQTSKTISVTLATKKPTLVVIDAFPTSNLFKAGHRIRLDVSSSNFPHFDVNPNTGAPEGSDGPKRMARNTVFMDRARPSHVILPIMPVRG